MPKASKPKTSKKVEELEEPETMSFRDEEEEISFLEKEMDDPPEVSTKDNSRKRAAENRNDMEELIRLAKKLKVDIASIRPEYDDLSEDYPMSTQDITPRYGLIEIFGEPAGKYIEPFANAVAQMLEAFPLEMAMLGRNAAKELRKMAGKLTQKKHPKLGVSL